MSLALLPGWCALSGRARHLMLFIAQHPNLRRGGRLREWPEGLARDLDTKPTNLRKALAELEASGFLRRDGPLITVCHLERRGALPCESHCAAAGQSACADDFLHPLSLLENSPHGKPAAWAQVQTAALFNEAPRGESTSGPQVDHKCSASAGAAPAGLNEELLNNIKIISSSSPQAPHAGPASVGAANVPNQALAQALHAGPASVGAANVPNQALAQALHAGPASVGVANVPNQASPQALHAGPASVGAANVPNQASPQAPHESHASRGGANVSKYGASSFSSSSASSASSASSPSAPEPLAADKPEESRLAQDWQPCLFTPWSPGGKIFTLPNIFGKPERVDARMVAEWSEIFEGRLNIERELVGLKNWLSTHPEDRPGPGADAMHKYIGNCLNWALHKRRRCQAKPQKATMSGAAFEAIAQNNVSELVANIFRKKDSRRLASAE